MRWIGNIGGVAVSGLWLSVAGVLIPLSLQAAQHEVPVDEQVGAVKLVKSKRQVDELTVTARKREESLQEVPISIAAFGDKQLQERNINNVYDVAQFTPNFNMSRNLGRRLDRPIVRGQSPPGRGKQNASFFVDDVYLPGEFGSIATSSLDNVERVEVIRGPQAALFGRATFAGAINYITRDIRDVWEGEVNARAGSDQDYKLSAWASGPIIENKLKVYVGGGYEGWDGEWRNDLREGQANASNDPATSLDFFNGPGVWRVNVPDIAAGEAPCPAGYSTWPGGADAGCPPQRADNSKLGGEELWNATLKLEFTPTDNLEFTVKAEYAETDDDHFAAFYFEPLYGPVGGVQLAPGLNCKPPVYDPNLPQTLPDGSTLDGTYIPSAGWFCGEIKFDQSRAQINIPNFAGVATCPPGAPGGCVETDGNGNPILDANGNIIPRIVSPPAPFIGAQTVSQRYLAQVVYTWKDWEFLARGTLGDYEEDNVRDLERNYSLGPVTTGLFEGFSRDRAENKSVELRAISPADSRLRGLFGYYYYMEEASGIQRRFNSFSDGYLFGFSRDEEVENNAIFGSITFDVTEQIFVTLDGRYAEDKLTQNASPELQSTCPECNGEATFYSFTPRFIVNYQPTDRLNFYASIAQGNKPGDFNGEWFDDNTDPLIIQAAKGVNCDPGAAPPGSNAAGWIPVVCNKAIVEEEKTVTWELGAKTLLMDGQLLFNTALFYIDWTNQGINNNQCVPRLDIIDGNGPNAGCEVNLGIINAGKSRVYGAEVELQYAATDYLNLGLAYGLADTKLEEYFDDGVAAFDCNWWEFSQASGSLVTRPLPDCEAQGTGNVSGNEGELVPKHSLNLSAIYQRPLKEDVDWFVKSFLNYESKKYVSVANLAEIGDTYIWNTSVGLQSDRWLITGYVNNILDDDTPTIVFDFPLFDNSKIPSLPGLPFGLNKVTAQAGFVPPQVFLVTPRRGRNYGVTLQYRFGG